jgi:excinuclease ABC subunit A
VLDDADHGLHPADVERLHAQLQSLVDAGNSVIVVEHEMRVVADADWVLDMGPGAGDDRRPRGGHAARRRKSRGPSGSRTAPYLARFLSGEGVD